MDWGAVPSVDAPPKTSTDDPRARGWETPMLPTMFRRYVLRLALAATLVLTIGSGTSLAVCGDDVLDGGEQCDDGNVAGGDCCSATCQFEANGDPCDDGSVCTAADACDGAGACTGDAAVQVGCRHVTVSHATPFHLRDDEPDKLDLVEWRWNRGTATTKADYGTPTVDGGTDYELCVYDETGPGTRVLLNVRAPAGGLCNAANPKPCWKESKVGFRYYDKDLTPDGMFQMTLREGIDGRARISVRGKGPNLEMPTPLSVTPPITVQLVNELGICWEAIYGL
jgi:cysteine-rich repeat protein